MKVLAETAVAIAILKGDGLQNAEKNKINGPKLQVTKRKQFSAHIVDFAQAHNGNMN